MLKETNEQKKKRASKIVDILSREYPDAHVHLDYENPFQLLISTILAAQCTDVKVNQVMGELYKKYKGPADFVKAKPETLMNELKSITFFRQKTRAVQNCCKSIVEKFKGKVPDTMEGLTSLAGVGRKTANVILMNCFNVPAIITDTHIIRLSQRMGLSQNEIGDKIESDLLKFIPEDMQKSYSLSVSEHGRQVCKARKPNCEECVINEICPKLI